MPNRDLLNDISHLIQSQHLEEIPLSRNLHHPDLTYSILHKQQIHFEETIIQLVALATLMPIVAAVGGNTGNQTSMLIIRSLALEQINSSNIRHFLLKEIGISLVNGLLWGAIMAAFVFFVYHNLGLGLVMMGAIFLNLLLATVAGIAVPMIRNHFNFDPAMGTSVVLTFFSDSLGFFLFLGLASLFL